MKDEHDINRLESEIGTALGHIEALAYHFEHETTASMPLAGEPYPPTLFGCSPPEVASAAFAAVRAFSRVAANRMERLMAAQRELQERLDAAGAGRDEGVACDGPEAAETERQRARDAAALDVLRLAKERPTEVILT